MVLDYAHQRVREALSQPQKVVLATSGPAGVQASEYACGADGLKLYLLVPLTSDHLFNLEHRSEVTLLSPFWELKGQAQTIPVEGVASLKLGLLQDPSRDWCALVQVEPTRLQLHREGGWGSIETYDI
jgi:hypothetical protein